MELFNYMEKYDFEQVVLCQDKNSGLKAIIAIHDTTLGPALGGTRMWTYESEEAAIEDALRLARGMTYKNAAAGLNLGGGKTVIIGDPKTAKSEELFRAFGRYVESLSGRYITAVDVGTTAEDMDLINLETEYVAGTASGKGASGNPSFVTAYGIYVGMKASAKEAFGTDSLKGKKVAIQGVGNVAYTLCEHLHEEGAELFVTDINKEAVQRAVDNFGATAVELDEIYGLDVDIFSPCALGAIINDETIEQFKCKVIAGSANNQLKEDRHGDKIHEMGIVYAPDYVINSGGVINVADELIGYNAERAMNRVGSIYETIERIYAISKRDGIPSYKAADRLAEERMESIGKSRAQFLQNEKSILSNK